MNFYVSGHAIHRFNQRVFYLKKGVMPFIAKRWITSNICFDGEKNQFRVSEIYTKKRKKAKVVLIGEKRKKDSKITIKTVLTVYSPVDFNSWLQRRIEKYEESVKYECV